MIEILNRYTKAMLYKADVSGVKGAVEQAVSSYANLSYANLSYADLSYANLSYANLSYANLGYADLSYANLSGSDLSYANLSGSDLSYANLSGSDLSYAKNFLNSHDMIAEILRREAGDDIERLSLAGLVLLQRTWCWGDFAKIQHSQRDWAVRILGPWANENSPKHLLVAIKELKRREARK